MLLVVARFAKGRAIVDAAQRSADERQTDLEIGRREFTTRVSNALEMAPTEQAALLLAEEALDRVMPEHPGEMLLADNSRAHLERVAVSAVAEPPACPVTSPEDCIAARRGHLQVFGDANEMDACPRLKCRSNHVASAVCVPVSVLGRTVGVIHATTPRAAAGFRDAGGRGDRRQPDVDAADPRQPARAAPRHDPGDVGDQPRRVHRQPHRLGEPASPGDGVQRTARRPARRCRSCSRTSTTSRSSTTGTATKPATARSARSRRRCAPRCDPDDIVCRYGGEEFVVVLPRCSAEDAQRVFQRVQKRVGMIGDDGRLPRFTASYGVTDSDGATSASTT